MTGTSPSKIVTPCTSFVPPLKSTIASPEMTIEHLAQISRLTCLFKSRLDQDDLTCKSCQWWHWINDDNDDTESGWLAVRVLPTPSCHHCRPGLAVVGVICYQGMLSPSSHQCQFIIAVLIVAGIADITLSHRLILKLAAKVFTWISNNKPQHGFWPRRYSLSTWRWSPKCCVQLPINDFKCCLNVADITLSHGLIL